MTTYHIGKPLSEGLVQYSTDGRSHVVETFNDFVDKSTNFERSFFDSGHYKAFFHQMLLATVLSVTKQPWSDRIIKPSIYSRSLGDEAVRVVVSIVERKKRQVNSLTFFMGRVDERPSGKQYTAMHAKDEHFVHNFKGLLRTLTKEEYGALKALMLEKENVDLDFIPIICTEYSIHPKSQNDGKLSATMSYLATKTEMRVKNRRSLVENLRNEPMSTIAEVNFHFSSPITNNELKRPNFLKNHDSHENREILDRNSITKTIEDIYSLYHEEFVPGDQTVKIMKEGLYSSNFGSCGFLFGVLGNLRTTLHSFFEHPKVQYNFDGTDEFLTMTFVDREKFILKRQAEKPLVVDFSASKPFGFLKYNMLKQIHNHLTPTVRVMRLTMNDAVDDIKVDLRLVKAPMPFDLSRFLNRRMSSNEEDYSKNVEQAIRSLIHSVFLSIDLQDKKLEYASAYLYGLFKSSGLKSTTVLKAGLLKNADSNDEHLINFLIETGQGKPILITFSNSETTSFKQVDLESTESILQIEIFKTKEGSSQSDFNLAVGKISNDVLESYDFRPITPVELIENFHKGPVRNYIYLNGIHPAQLVGFHNPLQSSVLESDFDEYVDEDKTEEIEPDVKKLKKSLSGERPTISEKLHNLLDGAEHVIKNKHSFAAMVDGMFAGIPKLKNKFLSTQTSDLTQRQFTVASFSQEKAEDLHLEGVNIQFHILDDQPIERETTDLNSGRLSRTDVNIDLEFDNDFEVPFISSHFSYNNPGPSGINLLMNSAALFDEIGQRNRGAFSTLEDIDDMDAMERIHATVERDFELQTSSIPRRSIPHTTIASDDPLFDEWRDPNEREPSSDESQSSLVYEIEERNPVELALENLQLLTTKTKQKLQSASDIQVQAENTISLVFDVRQSSKERITIASNNENFNTENVKTFCIESKSKNTYRRFRRWSLSSVLCPKGKHEQLMEDSDKTEFDEKLLDNKKIDAEVVKSARKLSKVCSIIQTGVISRDIMGDVINGDWTGVIRDGAFLGGMVASEKLGALVVQKGVSYLKIEKPLMDSLLHSLTPCVPKLGFDSFIGYNMYESIRHNDTVGATLDGVILGADAGECMAEALMAFDIIVATPIIGEIAMGLVTLSLIASSIYDAHQKVSSIQSLLPLRKEEASSEFWRAIFHIHSEPLITLLESEKDANKRIIESILEKNLTSRWFVTPSGRIIKGEKNQNVIEYQQNNIVNLKKRVKRPAATRALPDNTENYHLSCKMAEMFEKVDKGLWDKFFGFFHSTYEHIKHIFEPQEKENAPTEEDHFCINAFVVEITANKLNSNEAVYATHEGDDSIVGYPSADNVYLIGNGRKAIRGGKKKDTFSIFGRNLTGILDGHGGHNILDFSTTSCTGAAFFEGGAAGTLVMGGSTIDLQVNNITEIRGRQSYPDYVSLADCKMKTIDLKGGKDQIIISKMNCSSNLTVYLNDDIRVYQYNEKGSFKYIVQNMTGNKVLNFASKTDVKIVFTSLASFESQINYTKQKVIITENSGNIDAKVTMHGSIENLSLAFVDNALLTFYSNHAKLTVNSTDPLNTIVAKYANLLAASKISLTVHSTSEHETAVFNHGQLIVTDDKYGKNVSRYRITYNDVHHVSHLHADKNNGNIFIIRAGIHKKSLALPKVTIYDHASWNNSASVNMVDLRLLTAQISQMGDFSLKVKLNHKEHEDECRHIHLLLYIYRANNSRYKLLGEIEIRKGFDEKIYKNFIVINRGENFFVPTKRACQLKLKPLPMVMPEKDLTVIAPGQLEKHSVLFFRQPIAKVYVFRANDTLIITNLLSILKNSGKTKIKPFNVVFLNFFKYESIFKTISINFGFISKLKMKRIFQSSNNLNNIDRMWSLIVKFLI